MGTLNDVIVTDLVTDVLAAQYNALLGSNFLTSWSNDTTMSGTVTLSDSDYAIQRFNCNGVNRIVKLPAYSTSNHPYFIINTTALTYTLDVQNSSGTTILSAPLPAGGYALVVPDGTSGFVAVAYSGSSTFVGAGAGGDLAGTYPNPTIAKFSNTINVNSATALKIEQTGVMNNVLVVDTTNGRVGIGTAPTYSLHVNVGQSNDLYAGYVIRTITTQPTVSGNNVYSCVSQLNMNSSGTHSTDVYRALRGFVQTNSSDTATYNTTFVGTEGFTWHYGTGSITSAIGVSGSSYVESTTNAGTITTAIGGQFSAGVATSAIGIITNAVGAKSIIQSSGTTTITSAYGFQASSPIVGASGAITSIYGFYASNQGAAGVTNAYGLYIATQTGAATNNYAIYVNGSNSYYGGLIGIKETAPLSELHIQGTITSDPMNLAVSGNYPRGPLWILNNPASVVAGQSCGLYVDITNNPTGTPGGAGNYVAAVIRMTDTNNRVGQFWAIDAPVVQSNSGLGNSVIRSIEAEVASAIDSATDPYAGTGNRVNGIEIVGISGSKKLTAGMSVWANDTSGVSWWSRGIGISRVLDVGIQFYRNPGGASDSGTAFATAAIYDASNSATVLKVDGTHTQVIDVGGATLTRYVKMSATGAQTLIFGNGADQQANLQLDAGSTVAEQTSFIFSDRGTNKWSLIKNSSNFFAIFDNASGVSSIFINSSDFVGIGVNPAAGHRIETSDGAFCSTAGAWTNASSRAYKSNIQPLTLTEARDGIMDLEPIQYEHKSAPGDLNLGFIAEDVPEIFATPDRKGLSPMDFVAGLVKVVQDQQKRIEELEKIK